MAKWEMCRLRARKNRGWRVFAISYTTQGEVVIDQSDEQKDGWSDELCAPLIGRLLASGWEPIIMGDAYLTSLIFKRQLP